MFFPRLCDLHAGLSIVRPIARSFPFSVFLPPLVGLIALSCAPISWFIPSRQFHPFFSRQSYKMAEGFLIRSRPGSMWRRHLSPQMSIYHAPVPSPFLLFYPGFGITCYANLDGTFTFKTVETNLRDTLISFSMLVFYTFQKNFLTCAQLLWDSYTAKTRNEYKPSKGKSLEAPKHLLDVN